MCSLHGEPPVVSRTHGRWGWASSPLCMHPHRHDFIACIWHAFWVGCSEELAVCCEPWDDGPLLGFEIAAVPETLEKKFKPSLTARRQWTAAWPELPASSVFLFNF